MQVPPTAQSVLESTTHGRTRRNERNIEKIDLQRARRYGMKEPTRLGRTKYTYGGIVFIYDPVSNREVTSFASPDKASAFSGTKKVIPTMLPKIPMETSIIKNYELLNTLMKSQKFKWTSHSVLVVDMSGSMRRDDINGARCRSDGVWMTLAREYIQKPLNLETRSDTDMISVVIMKEYSEVIIHTECTNWYLYNKFIDLREWTTQRPSGPGNYMPALDAADRLLSINEQGSCALSLMFFSDGKPSDRGDFTSRMGQIASKFGRRLSVACIGMAEEGEDFSTLNHMVNEASSFGAVASFGKPSLDADSLSNIITGLASSLTTTKTELTNITTGQIRKIRMDLTREKLGAPDDMYADHNWECYDSYNNTKFVQAIHSYSYEKNDWTEVKDTRCSECFKPRNANYHRCSICLCAYFCKNCYSRDKMERHMSSNDCRYLTKKHRSGNFVRKSLTSWNVAVKKFIFGEGAERIVRKVRFLSDDSVTFIGPVYVAKESRFVEDDGAYKKKMDYHEEFMRTQTIASEFAKQFNFEISNASTFWSQRHKSIVDQQLSVIPRIEFLEPLVIQAFDEYKMDKEYNFLIEPMLEGIYEKFNDNMGMVKDQCKSVNLDDLCNGVMGMRLGSNNASGGLGLGAITEGSEDEEDTNDSDDEIINDKQNRPESGSYSLLSIKDSDIPQTFSHFSYIKSNKQLIVVDLQGVLAVNDDGTKTYRLTDPVIHKRRKTKKESLRKYTFGRTDRGEKGMSAFLHTHKCNELCRLLGLITEAK